MSADQTKGVLAAAQVHVILDSLAEHGWGGFANLLRDYVDTKAQEALRRSDLVVESLTDLSWRATRYAMDGKFAEHDVMVEAHRAVAELHGMPVVECDCKTRSDAS